jgi:hypothetical protein
MSHKFHARGGSYTFEQMEADVAARKAADETKKKAAAKMETIKPADPAPKADMAKADTPFGKPAN